jgi:hypothetical protein
MAKTAEKTNGPNRQGRPKFQGRKCQMNELTMGGNMAPTATEKQNAFPMDQGLRTNTANLDGWMRME